jgi:ADP-ribose pyrophosphatase YjhB (NUDIX family)
MAQGSPTRSREGASVVVLRRDTVLMVERAREPFAGAWSFPGGRVEPGEDAEANARRELLEETGLSVGEIVRIGPKAPVVGASTFKLTVFAARAGEGEPVAADDAKEAAFVPYGSVLERKTTAGAAGWVARAILALARPPLL